MHLLLTVTAGPHAGRVFTFDRHETFMVGRAPQAHFCLPDDPYFSRMHFLVEVNPPACRLLDLNSRNGTLVNGRKVPAADLQDGDEVAGGRTVLRVSLPAPALGQTLDLPAASDAAAGTSLAGEQPTVPPQLVSGSPTTTATAAGALPAVPGYRVQHPLGSGAMGVVYLATREADGATVALKTIRPAGQPTPTVVTRFLRETEVLGALRHPYIVAFHAAGAAGGLLYFVMDFVPGTDAEQLLRAVGPLPVGRAVALACQLLEALAHAHVQGFVHRDVKPSNLLVTQEDGRELAKLADFGLARTYQASPLSGLTLTGATGGTPSYMPPEQVLDFRGVRPAADQYAAAATLYRLLTNQRLYDGAATTADLFLKILQEEPVPIRRRRAELPPPLADAIHRALARAPEDRYPGVAEFRDALRPFAAT